jgi:hypothetical protein
VLSNLNSPVASSNFAIEPSYFGGAVGVGGGAAEEWEHAD